MNDLSIWKERLKNKSIRCTNQRTEILKVLIDSKLPLTASDIHSRLKYNNSKLRLSTVYRNLNCFVNENIVRKLNFKFNQSMFELLDGEHHQHLICIMCGEIIPIECPLKGYEEKLSSRTNYLITEHNLEMYGICPDCQKKLNKRN
jgi:Fur family transcriptional regulator, ferric uptake regulator